MSQAIVTPGPVISLQIPEGRWPLVGVQRNIVTVSLLCQVNNMRQWIRATGHGPSCATTTRTTVCCDISHQSDFLILFMLKALNYWHCRYCIQWWNSNRLIVSNWFTPRHFYFWQKSQNCGAVSLTTLEYLFLSLALTNGSQRYGVKPWGPVRVIYPAVDLRPDTSRE